MINKEDLKNSKSFCMLPYMHIYGSAGGDMVPCCEAQEIPLNNPGESALESWNNDNYRELRRALANDERPERCAVCWHNEDSGIVSNRQQWEHDNWNTFADKISVNDDYSVNNPPYWVELKVSNFCNLKCIMCSTHSSYKRVADLDIISKYTKDGYETRLLRPTDLFASLNEWPELWDHVHTLQFTGGEPIINKEHYDLLEGIPTEAKKRIRLRYASNLSYIKFKKYDLIKIWNEFKHVNIKVSMDGVGDVYNYIRQDGDWDTVYANMMALNNEPGIDVAAGITVQAHNIYQMPEFFQFWKDSPVDLKFITANILQTPNYLSPAIWQGEYRDAIIRKLRANQNEHPEMDRFATYMENNQHPYMLYARMRKYTRDIEERYKQDINLKKMVKTYLNMPLEGMDIVAQENERQSK
jgi:sulfatase maturation enzyme AslB (radical SAM superfamily)